MSVATHQVAQSVPLLDQPITKAAAERIAQVRHTWGWRFQQKHVKVMAVDLMMAEAALRVPEIAEALHRTWPGIYPAVVTPPKDGRNIIDRAAWDNLTAEHNRLQEQVRRYTLPTQRGCRNRARAKLDEVNRQIRAVDGVIGIDA